MTDWIRRMFGFGSHTAERLDRDELMEMAIEMNERRIENAKKAISCSNRELETMRGMIRLMREEAHGR